MNATRVFIHAAAATMEDMIDRAEIQGTVVETRGYRPPGGHGVYGSVEIHPHADREANES